MSKLIPEVSAQSEPTFPYDGPFEEPEPTTPSSDEATVTLTSSTSALQVGQTVTCDLNIESSEEASQGYSITITFDPSVLEVVDENATESGIQINFLDTSSTQQTNTASNTNGTITITATIPTYVTINKRVAQITFRAKNTETSIVSINKSESYVNDIIGDDILGTTTSLNFTVTGQSQTTTTTTASNQQLPSSGVLDTLATFGSIFGGVLMLYVGIKTIKDGHKPKSNI